MGTISKTVMAIALPAMLAASAVAAPVGKTELPSVASRLQYKAKGPQTVFNDTRMQKVNNLNSRLFTKSKSLKDVTPTVTLPGTESFDYIDAPDGSVWFFTTQFTYDEEVISEWYTEKYLKEYQFDIYGPDLKYYGSIKDKVVLKGTESKVAAIQLVPVLTKKFFNSDDKYELMVSLTFNNPDYSTNSRSLAYQIDGEKDEDGYDVSIYSMDGLLVDMLNATTDSWSENYYITFAQDGYDEAASDSYQDFLNSYHTTFDVYAKAGWGNSPKKILSRKLPYPQMPGDQQYATPIVTLADGGTPYFVFSQYVNNLYKDQASAWDEDFAQADDNELQIDVYKLSTSAATIVQTTKIPVVKSQEGDAYFSYYSVGSLGYKSDINFTDYGTEPGKAGFVITRWDYLLSDDDDYVNNYYVYDENGDLKFTLFEAADGDVSMSDIDGEDAQHLFVESSDDEYTFHFINMKNGEEEHSFAQKVNYNGEPEAITANIDRYPVGNSYEYVAEFSSPGVDDAGNDTMRIGWLTPEGKVDHVDIMNMGENIAYAQSYISQTALSPYIFHTDEAREYMILVKRYVGSGTTTQEELLISQPETLENPLGTTLLQLGPDAEKGSLSSIIPMNLTTDPTLLILYQDDDYVFHQDFYELPLSKFNGGDGTAANPYQIATVGDLHQIGKNPSAHYELVNDIDGSDMTFVAMCPSSAPFTGTLDGKGYTVSNLTISANEGTALFCNAVEAEVKDITFVNAKLDASGDSSAALLAVNSLGSKFENVHVLGLEVDGGDDAVSFGGLVDVASNSTVISDCSVANAVVNIPNSDDYSPVGGLVSIARTATKISASSFAGTINAGSTVGGIVGQVTADETIQNCHVDADIVGKNTIGGIAGYSKRAKITNCYVEGSLEATTKARSGGYKVGGIVGDLMDDYGPAWGGATAETSPEGDDESSDSSESGDAPEGGAGPDANSAVISNNIVNLSAITIPAYEGEVPEAENSVHRIVGFSSGINYEIDWDKTEDYTNPVYQETTAEAGLAANYAMGLSPVDAADEASATSLEGESIEGVDYDFLQTLGFAFGDSTDSPWNELYDTDPTLYHEEGIHLLKSEYTVYEGDTFDASLIIASRTALDADKVAGSISFSSTDESVAMMTGNCDLDGNTLVLEFEAGTEGVATVTVRVLGSSASFKVNVVKRPSGVEEIAAAASILGFNGSELTAAGSEITVYSLQGVRVAGGYESVDVIALDRGVYIARAGRSVLKFRK